MLENNEQLTKASQQGIEATYQFFNTSLKGFEKLAKLNFEISKKFLEETSQAVKDITSASSPKDALDRLNQLATQSAESQLSACKDAYEIIVNTQSQLGKVFESQVQSSQQSMVNSIDELAKFSPSSSSNFASESVKSFINGTNQVMDMMNKVAAQVSEVANESINAVTKATVATQRKSSSVKK